MDLLTNWDDLVHGTVVFAIAVPFLLVAGGGRALPRSRWWIAAVLALAVPAIWFFGWPSPLPRSSDDAALAALAVAAIATAVPGLLGSSVVRLVLFGLVAWLIYPAWLATDGGAIRKIGVAAAIAVSVVLTAGGAERALGYSKCPLSLASFIPPAIALSVLLQLGGAGRFAQMVGALVSVMAAVTVVIFWRRLPLDGDGRLAAFLVGAAVFFGWCGWLFAELRYGLAFLLLAAPFGALVVSKFPLPREKAWQRALGDLVGASVVSGTVALVAIVGYLQDSAGSDGY